ncbi:LysR family transcriptional regulator substrate-binding protein [Corynebacterium caspium]|uniref:LysR family transcriptional regulator substrate-binding protein n=1 Tax=Corynebacterium caspium TaxID=234828 RepID=UPI000380B3ED|nr:LysR family transcriptional regulator substrate-binding protein [Corynebacterium caspium]WKD59551.1 LysR substrate binding domain protein [Corynebacterium caspium DSM 44850]
MPTLSFVTGTEPAKWFQRYNSYTANPQLETHISDDPLSELLAGQVDLALIRLPDARFTAALREDYHLVELYEEALGVAVPAESIFAEIGQRELPRQELAAEIINYEIPDTGQVDIAAVRSALQIVAANVGIAIAPYPLLRVLSGKLVAPLLLQDDKVRPANIIALLWHKDKDSPAIQDFVGITRGRRASSGRSSAGTAAKPATKLKAKEKSQAKATRKAAREKQAAKQGKAGKAVKAGKGAKPGKPGRRRK